jgi:hypothetical protein
MRISETNPWLCIYDLMHPVLEWIRLYRTWRPGCVAGAPTELLCVSICWWAVPIGYIVLVAVELD